VTWSETDQAFMREAIGEARVAGEVGEVPVGALVVMGGKVVARGINRTLSDNDPSAHAEVVAIRSAAAEIGSPRLSGATLYVTLEPCPMCMGALVQARIERLVFGAYDPKAGAAGSAVDLTDSPAFNHRFEVNGGVLAGDCGAVLKSFFDVRRGV
jgi:tRNA(adenine34) deaminase